MNYQGLHRLFISICLWIGVVYLGMAQPNLDSLWATADTIAEDSSKILHLHEIGYSYRNTDPEFGIVFLEKLKNSALFNNQDYFKSLDYHIGELYYHTGDMKTAEQYLWAHHDLYQNLDEYKNSHKERLRKKRRLEMGTAKLKLATIYRHNELNDKALMMIKEAADHLWSIRDTMRYVLATTQECQLLNYLHRTDDAISKAHSLIPLAKNIPTALMGIYNSLSVSFDVLKNIDSSMYYSSKYHELVMDTDNIPNQFISSYNLALAYQAHKQYDKAQTLFDQSIQLAKKSKVPWLLPYGYISKAGLMTETGRYSKGLQLAQKVDKMPLRKDQKLLVYQSYYEAHKGLGHYADALQYHEKWKTLNDSIATEKLESTANELQIKYESAKKEKQIVQLSNDKMLQSHRITMQRYGLLGLVIGLLALGYFLIKLSKQRNKIRQQNNIITKALEDKDILLKEIHHRVKNNLQVISSLLNLQSNYISNEKALAAITEGKNRVASMALIHQYLYQKDHITSLDSKEYFDELIDSLLDSYDIEEHQLQLKKEIESIRIDVDTMVPIGLIVNELVSNALKHAWDEHGEKGVLTIQFKEIDDALYLEVSDNGIGMTQEKFLSSNSFGNKLIMSFRQKLDASIEIINQQGTSVRVSIHNYKKAA